MNKDRSVILDTCRNVGFVSKTVHQSPDEATRSYLHKAGMIRILITSSTTFPNFEDFCQVPRAVAKDSWMESRVAGAIFVIAPISTFCLGVWQYRLEILKGVLSVFDTMF